MGAFYEVGNAGVLDQGCTLTVRSLIPGPA